MKIVVTGSHGVGKSAICRAILSELRGEHISTKEDVMRLAVTGAHGTGKSTLAKLAAGKLDYRFIPEAAFECHQAGFQLNEKTGIEAEMWILCRQIEQEMRAGANWVSDRCLVDTLAYSRHFFKGHYRLLDLMDEMALPYIRQYSKILYLPAGEFPIEDDGFRSLDPRFQQETDEQIREVMELYAIPYHTIRGNVTERLAAIKQLL